MSDGTLLERLRSRAATPGPEEPPATISFPDSLPYLRASSIRTYLRCPRQFWYVYVQGLRVPPGAAATAGTAMHRAAELGLLEKIDTGKDPDPDDSAQAAAEVAGELTATADGTVLRDSVTGVDPVVRVVELQLASGPSITHATAWSPSTGVVLTVSASGDSAPSTDVAALARAALTVG